MKCPVCKDPSLVISERKGVEIDYCPECRGVWLDRGELDKILEKSRAEEVNYQQEIPSQQRNQKDNYQKPYKRKKSIFEELFD